MAEIFNGDVIARSGAAGAGKIGYDTGLFLGSMPVEEFNADVSLGWDHRGKLIAIKSLSSARTVTLPALSTLVDGLMFFVQRNGSRTVHIVPSGSDVINGAAIQFDLETDHSWAVITADDNAGYWRILAVGGQTSVEVTDSSNVNLSLTGTGTISDPYNISADVIIDTDASNLLGTRTGLLAKLNVDPNTVVGDGTSGNPLRVASIALTNVSVVADIAARDALANPHTGDVAKVSDAGNGHPSTYIYDGAVWVEVQSVSDVHSVNGQTGIVSLALPDMTDVTAGVAFEGDVLVFDGTGWWSEPLPVSAYVTVINTVAGGTVNVNHGLGTSTVTYKARNTATDEYENLVVKRVDDNTLRVSANAALQYEIRVRGGLQANSNHGVNWNSRNGVSWRPTGSFNQNGDTIWNT